MKKFLTYTLMLWTLVSFSSTNINTYTSNNGDVTHTRNGSLERNSYVITDINLHATYVTKTNFQNVTDNILRNINNGNNNTSNSISKLEKDLKEIISDLQSDTTNDLVNLEKDLKEIISDLQSDTTNDLVNLENKKLDKIVFNNFETNYISDKNMLIGLINSGSGNASNNTHELEIKINNSISNLQNDIELELNTLESNKLDTVTFNNDINNVYTNIYELTTNLNNKLDISSFEVYTNDTYSTITNLDTIKLDISSFEVYTNNINSNLNNLTSNIYTKTEIDNTINDLETTISTNNTILTNSIYTLSTNKVSKVEVDNIITNILYGIVFDISNLEKVQETLNIIILKLGGSVTNTVVTP